MNPVEKCSGKCHRERVGQGCKFRARVGGGGTLGKKRVRAEALFKTGLQPGAHFPQGAQLRGKERIPALSGIRKGPSREERLVCDSPSTG